MPILDHLCFCLKTTDFLKLRGRSIHRDLKTKLREWPWDVGLIGAILVSLLRTLHLLLEGDFDKFCRAAKRHQNRHTHIAVKDILRRHGFAETN